MNRTALCVVLLASAFAALSCAEPKIGIEVSDGWVRAMPASSSATAAYLTLENHGPGPMTLIGVSAPWAPQVMLHRTEASDGVLRMGHLESVELGVGEAVEATENTWHVMLMGLEQAPVVGESLPLTLEFQDGSTMEVTFPVQRDAANQ